jgi:hypothetical protein
MSREGPESAARSLDEQRLEFAQRRGLAMPLAGLIAWSVVGVGGLSLPKVPAVWLLFGATGSIVYLGMFISRFTGENFLDRSRPKNAFDGLFFHAVAMSLLVYAIAIPFFLLDYTSLPLTVGILAGLMWVPLSWIIQHWVGLFHGIARTLLVTLTWYVFPGARFVAVPLVIVVLYAITIVILEQRWRRLGVVHQTSTTLSSSQRRPAHEADH